MSSQLREINLDDDIDRNRYRCPRGHAQWEPVNFHFYCASCARGYEFDGEFQELLDATNNRMLGREEIVLETDAGSYKDLFKSGSSD